MEWVLVLLSLGLLGFLVQMWLSYQKQADAMIAQQEETRGQIDGHLEAIEKLGKRTEEVRQRISELSTEQDNLKEELETAQGELAEMEESRSSRSQTRQAVKLDEVEES